MVRHVFHASATHGEELRDRTEMFFWDVNSDALNWFVSLLVNRSSDDLWFTDGEFETFAAHRFDEHCELQFAARENFPCVWAVGLVNPKRNVSNEFLFKAAFHKPSGESITISAGKRRGVDSDRHRQSRFINGDAWKRYWMLNVGKGFANGDVVDTCHRNKVASGC
jgi:hypothetical protein